MTDQVLPNEPEIQGGTASAEEGQVMLDGPDGVAVAMSPEAATATAHSLLAAADQASEQRGAEGHPS